MTWIFVNAFLQASRFSFFTYFTYLNEILTKLPFSSSNGPDFCKINWRIYNLARQKWQMAARWLLSTVKVRYMTIMLPSPQWNLIRMKMLPSHLVTRDRIIFRNSIRNHPKTEKIHEKPWRCMLILHAVGHMAGNCKLMLFMELYHKILPVLAGILSKYDV